MMKKAMVKSSTNKYNIPDKDANSYTNFVRIENSSILIKFCITMLNAIKYFYLS